MSACFCVGPQNGEPLCPCQMRHVERRNGRYVQTIDYGPTNDERRTDQLPVIPPLPKDYPPTEHNPPVAICGECGRTVHMIESYSCPNSRCPVQPKAIAETER